MQSITKEYLLDIIYRRISTTIHLQRKQHPQSFNVAAYPMANRHEMEEFIFSIPYFDSTLKNFLSANSGQQTIISQTWELEFIKKCELWMQSYEWLYGMPSLHNDNVRKGEMYLGLPY
jgi:hypothetical protein